MSNVFTLKSIYNIIKIEVKKMIYPSIDKLLNIVDSKYALVHIVSRRAEQMHEDHFFQMRERDYK